MKDKVKLLGFRFSFTFTFTFITLLLLVVSPLQAQKSITVVWAEWSPAEYLMELSKDFTKETGVKVNGVFIPWPNFQDKVFTALAAKDDAYDIVIGDSQWLGRASSAGHYVELTDWMKKNIDIKQIYEPALVAYGEYPKGSGKYWAAPCEADANGFAYRKDLFEDPKEKAAFKAKYGYELKVPETYQQLRDIAEFFTRPEKKLYGLAAWYSKSYDGVTMGFQQVMWSFGGSYGDEKTYKVDGILNSDAGVKALEFYASLKKFTPPGSENYYWNECLTAFQQGLVAMAMDYFAFFPGLEDPKSNPYAKVTGFFAAPGAKGSDGKIRRYISIGGQGMSLSQYSKNKELARQYMQWFSRKDVQVKWAKLGGYTANKEVLQSADFLKATTFNKAFADSFPYLRDFWAVPEYAELLEACQNHWNAAVVGQETPKQAMDAIAKEHTAIFTKAGRYKK
jgi:multiple sugar transport system substrate-binding protein